ALRVSMEEQRQRQEEEARRAAAASAVEAGIVTPMNEGGDLTPYCTLRSDSCQCPLSLSSQLARNSRVSVCY
ncbi:hypothetical protein chiPu_0029341, partial [Chiloscyllium punctatum]|nr:hypothetical protein [Chiloscyllium punctatum]